MEGRWALPARGSRADAVLIAVAPAGSAPDGGGEQGGWSPGSFSLREEEG